MTDMNLTEYREREIEKARVDSLFALMPARIGSALDVGARDGFLSLRLAERCKAVTALDLNPLAIDHPSIKCVQGDVCALDFDDNSFDVVLCAEVLEHIPPHLLPKACSELARVTREHLIIGVPFRQDTRVGRTTCQACGHRNPPFGHLNAFDERALRQLFGEWCQWEKSSFVGERRETTNPVSVHLLDWAGNPFGTYRQHEPCVACGARLRKPAGRTVLQKVATKAAYTLNGLQQKAASPRPAWIHAKLAKIETGIRPHAAVAAVGV